MPRYKLLIGRFPYGNIEDSRLTTWLMRLSAQLAADPRFEVTTLPLNDTPITMTRNRMFQLAQKGGIDLLLIVDSDIVPDCELGEDPAAKPFFDTSVDFLLNHPGPCVVGAPYCGPPPHENVYVFQWTNWGGRQPNVDLALEQYPREEAARLTGIREVGALPTGLMLLDMRAFKGIPHPWTYYEWKGDGPPCPHCGVRARGPESEKGSTEDVTLTRDLSLAGVKQYCNWDAWAGHVKQKVVRKPRPWTADIVAARLRDAIVKGTTDTEKLIDVKCDPALLQPPPAPPAAAGGAKLSATSLFDVDPIA